MKDKVLKYLVERPRISRVGLEQDCNIPRGLIGKAIRGVQELSPKHIKSLIIELKKYGFNETNT